MRVLVCGGRAYKGRAVLFAELDRLHSEHAIECVIEGGATGADTFGRQWAKERNVAFEEFRANWREHGRAAGMLRNQEMLDSGKPTLVLAFPGGRGTADMIWRAELVGVEVREIAETR